MKIPAEEKSAKTACVCCNGEFRVSEKARYLALHADILIAADGGARHLAAMGLMPDAIVGDMDSLKEDPWEGQSSLIRILLPVDKDRSDTEYAVQWALDQGVSQVLLLGAWGGRLDHALANAALLLRYPGLVVLWDDDFALWAMEAGQGAELGATRGALVSLVPFAKNTCVRTGGLKFSLHNEPLEFATHGLSNEAGDDFPSVAVSKGLILLCVKGEDPWLRN